MRQTKSAPRDGSGQLRLAPRGQVIEVDMDTVLRLAAARGYDLAVVSELLPAVEAGLVEAGLVEALRAAGDPTEA